MRERAEDVVSIPAKTNVLFYSSAPRDSEIKNGHERDLGRKGD